MDNQKECEVGDVIAKAGILRIGVVLALLDRVSRAPTRMGKRGIELVYSRLGDQESTLVTEGGNM